MAGGERVLLIDVGNTSTSLALAVGTRIGRRSEFPTGETSGGVIREALRRYGGRGGAIDGACLSSVVPRVNEKWRAAVRRACGRGPVDVHAALRLGVGIDYPQPHQIGADRLANASGASLLFGCPVVVADFGTALTFDVVSSAGDYIGGVIAPGPPFMTDYLAEKTALLPRVTAGRVRHRVGRSTVEAMRIGARIGCWGLVREILAHLRSELGADTPCCATGGYAGRALAGFDMPVEIVPDLTFRGLLRIYELNHEP